MSNIICYYCVFFFFISCAGSREELVDSNIDGFCKVVYAIGYKDGGSMGFALVNTQDIQITQYCILSRRFGYEGVFVGKLYPKAGSSKRVINDKAFLKSVLLICQEQVGEDQVDAGLKALEVGKTDIKDILEFEALLKSYPISKRAAIELGAYIKYTLPEF